MYWCNSPQKIIHCCDYGTDGSIANLRIFADLQHEAGEPDGSTIDADGFLWNARWGGSRLVRFAPDGRVERTLALPVAQPSCVSFGGIGLATIHTSTAWRHMSEAERATQPLSGGVFGLTLKDIKGLPEQRFLGVPA
jgi:L-arabinonolactonase